jgi:small subunit ribosomal protein S3
VGHKVHPYGFRIGVIRDWKAKWYAEKHYTESLLEDWRCAELLRPRPLRVVLPG